MWSPTRGHELDIFATCHHVNDLINGGNESAARNALIQLLAKVETDGLEYSPLINRLIRHVGLFPYLEPSTSSWEDRYVYEAFKADVGAGEPVTLHREQSRLLNELLSGKSIAVSAPTSFGKSFVIDAFISIRRPKTVVILVPTIALADETRRRLQKKFGATYKVITTSDQSMNEKNIFIFPQERAIGYMHMLERVDILIVDEFYKASAFFDKERSATLVRSIIRLGSIASQRYYLAPNITELKENALTKGMEFLRLDFNTVFLERSDLFADIGRDEKRKSQVLLGVLSANPGKTLIYAGTYANIKKVANLLMSSLKPTRRELLDNFQAWLATNYDPNWELTKLVVKGVGIHNGQLHRSLSQIQIRLFEEVQGLNQLISTSSIIEGVNTSAENVILWSNKNGRARIDDFTYKNIIGRGGRMFRHFVGKVFVLEEPPAESPTQLDLSIPEELLGTLDEFDTNLGLSSDQLDAIHAYQGEMRAAVGSENFEYFKSANVFQSSNARLILNIAKSIRQGPTTWNGLSYLNSSDTSQWDRHLYNLMQLQPGGWDIEWSKYVEFVKVLADNWSKTIPELLEDLSVQDISIDEFFKLERNTTFKLASLLGDVCTIYNRLHRTRPIEMSPAIARLAHAFLPPIVYQLEEYGIPRMISRKIQATGIIDLEDTAVDIHDVLRKFQAIGIESLERAVGDLDDFDRYILRYFFDGIDTKDADQAAIV
jgi:hypothetical protein